MYNKIEKTGFPNFFVSRHKKILFRGSVINEKFLKMDGHLRKLSNYIVELDKVIEPSDFSIASAASIDLLFKQMNQVIDEAEKAIVNSVPTDKLEKAFDEYLLNHGISDNQIERAIKKVQLQPTNLRFKVPCEGPNKRLWEACSCYYIDQLTKAMINYDKDLYEEAIMDLIDIGRGFDREMDNAHDAYEEMRDDENRAAKLYGNIYERKAGDPHPPPLQEANKMLYKVHGTIERKNDFWQEVIHGTPEEAMQDN